MARDDDRSRVPAQRYAHVARRVRSGDGSRDLAVAPRAAGRRFAASRRTPRGGSRRCRGGRLGRRARRRPCPPAQRACPRSRVGRTLGGSVSSVARRSGMPRAPGSSTAVIPDSLQPTPHRPMAVSNAIVPVVIAPIIDQNPIATLPVASRVLEGETELIWTFVHAGIDERPSPERRRASMIESRPSASMPTSTSGGSREHNRAWPPDRWGRSGGHDVVLSSAPAG